MRIVSWNINSLNRRLDLLLAWLDRHQPDVVCLQETKCGPDKFPSLPLIGAGYDVHAVGDGAWNGVAILSRVGLEDPADSLADPPAWEGTVEPRAVGATCAGVRVWSLYVPNGRDLNHPHFDYKLAWLDALAATSQLERSDHAALLLVGDFNIAPTDEDVHDISAFEGSTHVTDAERARLTALEDIGLRQLSPRPLKYDRAYTYWDYRQLAFPKNRGMRIDLAYGSPAVVDRVSDAFVDREARKGKGTSDHAPVVVDLDEDPSWPPSD